MIILNNETLFNLIGWLILVSGVLLILLYIVYRSHILIPVVYLVDYFILIVAGIGYLHVSRDQQLKFVLLNFAITMAFHLWEVYSPKRMYYVIGCHVRYNVTLYQDLANALLKILKEHERYPADFVFFPWGILYLKNPTKTLEKDVKKIYKEHLPYQRDLKYFRLLLIFLALCFYVVLFLRVYMVV